MEDVVATLGNARMHSYTALRTLSSEATTLGNAFSRWKPRRSIHVCKCIRSYIHEFKFVFANVPTCQLCSSQLSPSNGRGLSSLEAGDMFKCMFTRQNQREPSHGVAFKERPLGFRRNLR